MPLHLYPSIHASGKVPAGWKPAKNQPRKMAVNNAKNLRYLRSLLPGVWHKVIKVGVDGTEVHYFEHASGQVAGVKYLP